MTQPSSATTLLCISGSGRSGTTILSVLLSQQQDIFNLGQLRDVWKAYADDAPCSCGNTLNKCAFWSRTMRQAFPDWTATDFRNMGKKIHSFIKTAGRTRDWNNPQVLARLRDKHTDTIAALGSVLLQCRETSGAYILIDTSKSPELALAFSLADDIDVHVLDFIRDPRAVAVSWVKKHGKKGAGRIARKRSAQWKARHGRLQSWGAGLGKAYHAIRYEDFVASPQKTLATILALVGKTLPEALFTSEKHARVDWQRQHLYPPANERVLAEKCSDVEVLAPVSWKARKNFRIHAAALLHTFPLGIKYIFSRTPDD